MSATALIAASPRRCLPVPEWTSARLTTAETTVAERLLNGRSPQDIAADTGTSVGTVRNHVHRILSKAHCKSQVELLALLRRYGC